MIYLFLMMLIEIKIGSGPKHHVTVSLLRENMAAVTSSETSLYSGCHVYINDTLSFS